MSHRRSIPMHRQTMSAVSRLKSSAQEVTRIFQAVTPILKYNRSVAAESLWPTAVDKEADKASDILRSFFLDGFIVPCRKTVGRCPEHVFRDCYALAVLHVLRTGLRSPSASGSGVLVSRLDDGKWSDASAILADYDLPEGIDVADIIVVVNDEVSLNTLSKSSSVLGEDLAIKRGPISQGEASTTQLQAVSPRENISLVYVKSKGQLLDIDAKHMIIRQASKENERFYKDSRASAQEILSRQVETMDGASDLYSTLGALDRLDTNLGELPKPGKCPGDCRVRAPEKKPS